MPPLFRDDSSAKSAKSDGQLDYVSHQQQKHHSFSENSCQDASQHSPDFHLSSETPNSIPLSSTTFDNSACKLSLEMTDQEDTTDSDNNEPLWAAQPPLSLTPLKLLEILEQSFLETVLVDARSQPVAVLTGAVCVEALGNLIESPLASPNTDPSSPFMVSDNPLSTFASERLNHANVPLQTFEERLNASHVVIYDDDGKIGGTADRVARALRQSGRCQSSLHLEGGLKTWIHNFGNSLMDPAAWAVRDGIVVEEQPATEIQELRARQAKLVQAVWHTKPIPWSVFTGQCGEVFLDENGKERRKRLEQQIGADMRNNAPDGTIFPSLPEDDCVNKSLSTANENVEYDDDFGQFLSASSLSSSQQIVPFQDYPHEILPNLFLGGETTALEDRLRAFNIRQVVRIGWFWTPLVEGVRYFDYCLLDDITAANSIQRVIPQAIEAIACALEKGESVLVHCQAGVSRSATVILAYLMRYHSLTLRQAWDLVFRIRPIIRPNKGFAHVLLWYEKQLKSEGIIPSCIPLSSTVRFSKNTESQIPIPLYWVCESFDHYREYLEVEVRLRQLRRKLENSHSCGKPPKSRIATTSSTSSPHSSSSTFSCPSPRPSDLLNQPSSKLVTQPETMNVPIIVREE